MYDTNPQVQLFLAQLKSYALFAEVLKFYLRKQELLPTHLAERLFVEPATVSNWRKNKRLPDNLALIHQMAVALDLLPPEQENLVVAWCTTRLVRDLIPFLEEAIRNGDGKHAMQLAQTILGKSTNGQF